MKISGMVLSLLHTGDLLSMCEDDFFVGNGKRRPSQNIFSEEHLTANGLKI